MLALVPTAALGCGGSEASQKPTIKIPVAPSPQVGPSVAPAEAAPSGTVPLSWSALGKAESGLSVPPGFLPDSFPSTIDTTGTCFIEEVWFRTSAGDMRTVKLGRLNVRDDLRRLPQDEGGGWRELPVADEEVHALDTLKGKLKPLKVTNGPITILQVDSGVTVPYRDPFPSIARWAAAQPATQQIVIEVDAALNAKPQRLSRTCLLNGLCYAEYLSDVALPRSFLPKAHALGLAPETAGLPTPVLFGMLQGVHTMVAFGEHEQKGAVVAFDGQMPGGHRPQMCEPEFQ